MIYNPSTASQHNSQKAYAEENKKLEWYTNGMFADILQDDTEEI
jgi:hypothetical protein